MTDHSRKPRAIMLHDAVAQKSPQQPAKTRHPRVLKDAAELIEVPDGAANGLVLALEPPLAPAKAKVFGWSSVLVAALAGLVSLGTGLAVDQLIADLFARNSWLGWTAAILSALAVLAALALAAREMLALMRLRAIGRLREQAQIANDQDDTKIAKALIGELIALYGSRADTARGRAVLAGHASEIIDGSDLVALAERDLLAPLDARARTIVMDSAKRVSIVTAISPRALIDLAFVLMENVRLIRRLSQLYGGRPGTLGFWRLARNVLAHLAATGAIAVGDSIVQQLVGHGLAARLSARLGEGVINGLLTARIGIASIDVCRPVPFINERRPGISDFLAELIKLNGLQKVAGNDSLHASAPDRDPKTGRLMK